MRIRISFTVHAPWDLRMWNYDILTPDPQMPLHSSSGCLPRTFSRLISLSK